MSSPGPRRRLSTGRVQFFFFRLATCHPEQQGLLKVEDHVDGLRWRRPVRRRQLVVEWKVRYHCGDVYRPPLRDARHIEQVQLLETPEHPVGPLED